VSKGLITLLVILFVLAVGFSYILAKYTDQAEVLRAQQEMGRLQDQRDSILKLAAGKDSLVALLQSEVRTREETIRSLKEQRQDMEQARAHAESAIWHLFHDDSIMVIFKKEWPQYAHSQWGFTEVADRTTGLHVKYFVAPWSFTNEILNNCNDARSYREQSQMLLKTVGLQDTVIHLEKRIAGLESEKAMAFRNGYDSAYTLYTGLNEKYVKLLENPRIDMGFAGWLPVAGGVALGVIGGVAADRIGR
jgi:hypothetical protein